ncbi:Androgen-induced gene 1 protein [Fukomys damarensis]|uniref:Androgen-induced gene 1 protein n=1 Tax=Fukomys damarensis TaxID=885580 RepID=A0A091EAJ7_FUKDA|nr:Androgen-induced gene 1 protein [Fukomys damarensis]
MYDMRSRVRNDALRKFLFNGRVAKIELTGRSMNIQSSGTKAKKNWHPRQQYGFMEHQERSQTVMRGRMNAKVCWVHHVTGMWVYPFLEHIGSGARIVFFGSTTILMNFLYLLGEVLNNYIWDTQRKEEKEGGGRTGAGGEGVGEEKKEEEGKEEEEKGEEEEEEKGEEEEEKGRRIRRTKRT